MPQYRILAERPDLLKSVFMILGGGSRLPTTYHLYDGGTKPEKSLELGEMVDYLRSVFGHRVNPEDLRKEAFNGGHTFFYVPEYY